MWVIEIATGKKKRIRIEDYVAQWLDPEHPKYINIEKMKKNEK